MLGDTLGSPADVQDELGRSVALQSLLRREDVSGRDIAAVLTRRRDGFAVNLEHKAALATVVQGESEEGVRAITSELVQGMTDSDEGRRTRSRELLVSLGERAVGPMIAAMDRPEARQEAAIVLGRLRDARAVRRLVQSLGDEAPGVRAASAWALGEIRDPVAIEPLAPLTRDPSYEVRSAASDAVNEFGNVAVLAHVTSLLRPVIKELERANPSADLPALPPGPNGPLSTPAEPGAAKSRGAIARLVRERLGIE